MRDALTLIPAQIRKAAYIALFFAGVLVGALNVAEVNTGKAVDVIAYLGTALGLVAAGNVSGAKRNEVGAMALSIKIRGDELIRAARATKRRDEDGVTIVEVCIVLTFVGVLLLLCGKSFV